MYDHVRDLKMEEDGHEKHQQHKCPFFLIYTTRNTYNFVRKARELIPHGCGDQPLLQEITILQAPLFPIVATSLPVSFNPNI